ncbi:hypothetical protein PA07A_0523 [Cutibacterium acnes P07A]|nr:hypothetical protein [Cutibacterium acnes P07A]
MPQQTRIFFSIMVTTPPLGNLIVPWMWSTKGFFHDVKRAPFRGLVRYDHDTLED